MRFTLVALLVTACGSSTVPCPVPPPGPLPELPAQPGFTVRRCPPASTQPYQDSEFFAERIGTHPATDAEIAAFNARHASALIADGATAVGIGACCQAGPSALCLAVDVQAETPGASSLLANLDRMVREDGTPELGLPVKIALAPVRLPRCAASDPACGRSATTTSARRATRSTARARWSAAPTPTRATCAAPMETATRTGAATRAHRIARAACPGPASTRSRLSTPGAAASRAAAAGSTEPDYPGYFASPTHGRAWLQDFFAWSNDDHHHTGLALLMCRSVSTAASSGSSD